MGDAGCPDPALAGPHNQVGVCPTPKDAAPTSPHGLPLPVDPFPWLGPLRALALASLGPRFEEIKIEEENTELSKAVEFRQLLGPRRRAPDLASHAPWRSGLSSLAGPEVVDGAGRVKPDSVTKPTH